ncbi:hypothetical protein M3148_06950 [Georgenia satyanarayanai]|uniref:hypothetical protein n=1 Tax=Georgenia satyanarayanai TaxID=860221 RepID=UPI00203F0DF6|nr:hypothetical protein [Georgenia satyanarayanai]MCM3660732.1 hypothetical protein [Georgenia satyanarayanai]
MSTLLLWLCEGAALPPALDAAVCRSTAHHPDDRHPDVGAWLADVESALAVPPVTVEPATPTTAPAPRRRRRAPLGVALAVLLAAVAGLVGGVQLAGGLGAEDSSGAAAITIDGPGEITVGEHATFTAVVEGVDGWVWTMPSGDHVVDAPSVSTTARSPGSARVVLRARAPDGTDLESVHHLTVRE